jgi:hypothetical protein
MVIFHSYVSSPQGSTGYITIAPRLTIWLVVEPPVWKIMQFVSWDDDITEWKVIKFHGSKPPIRYNIYILYYIVHILLYIYIVCIYIYLGEFTSILRYPGYTRLGKLALRPGMQMLFRCPDCLKCAESWRWHPRWMRKITTKQWWTPNGWFLVP